MTVTAPTAAVDPSGRMPDAPARRAGIRDGWAQRWREASEPTRSVLVVSAVALAVFGLVFAAVALTAIGAYAAAWFPATGVSIGAVAVTRGRRRSALLVAVGLASLLGLLAGGRPPSLAVCFSIAHVVEAAGAGRWLGTSNRLTLVSMRDLGRLLLATTIAAVVAGALDSAAVWHFAGANPGPTFATVTMAHATGALVLLPLVMRVPAYSTVIRRGELLAQLAAVLAVTALVFAPSQRLSLKFVVVVLLVWSGLRLGARAAAVQLLLVSAVATLLTIGYRRPEGSTGLTAGPVAANYVLQSFLLGCTV